MQTRRDMLGSSIKSAAFSGLIGAAVVAPHGNRACAKSRPASNLAAVPVTDWVVVPKRKGALDWAALIRHAAWTGPVQLSPEVVAMNRTIVEVDGYFLPYIQDKSPVFLMTPYLTHCEGCLPNHPFSVVGIAAKTILDEEPQTPFTYRGQFVIAPENPSGYPFWIIDAEPVSL